MIKFIIITVAILAIVALTHETDPLKKYHLQEHHPKKCSVVIRIIRHFGME